MSLAPNSGQPPVPSIPVKQKFSLPAKLLAELNRSTPRSLVPAPSKIAQVPKTPATPAAPAVKQTFDISNAEFVTTVFGKLPENTFAAVCSKKGDPTTGNWFAMTAGATNLQTPNDRNNYINCSSFFADEKGNVKARKDGFSAMHFILLDDLGSKVSLSELCALPPSY